MVNGLYTAARGMMNILDKQDMSANNLANAHTNGYKRGQLATQVKINVARNEEGKLNQSERQTLNQGYTDFSQGPMLGTSSNFDLALAGKGFFTVEGKDGPRFTRNGAFTLNAQHQLVTLTGNKVLDENQRPIEVRGEGFQVRGDGSVFTEGVRLAKLGVVDFKDPGKLLAGGDGYFRNPDPAANPMRKADAAEVKQGFIEGSNVDTVSAMVTMMVQTRNYESDMRSVQAIDETLNRAVNDIGKVG